MYLFTKRTYDPFNLDRYDERNPFITCSYKFNWENIFILLIMSLLFQVS